MAESHLLIVHQGALGDFVAAFPAVIQLKKKFDRTDVLCQNRLGKLAKTLGLVDKWFPLEAAAFASLFTNRIDPKIRNLLSSYSTIVLFSFSRELEESINRITGGGYRLLPRPPAEERIHITQFLFENLINCGLLEKTYSSSDYFLTPNNFRGSPDQPKNPDMILIHPGAGSIRKRWPFSQFLKLEAVLKSEGLKPEFICGPVEGDLVDKLRNNDRKVHILHEPTDLLTLFKAAGGYIGNDSGISHLAAFLGVPTTVIFGPSDPRRWKPIGRAVEIVRPDLECNPCFEIEPNNCPEPECLADVSAESVLNAFYQVYNI